MTSSVSQAITDLVGPRCGCPDCESGVSPGAYLATLADYVVKVVQADSEPMSLEFLERRFHQPFGTLPTDCGGMETSLPHCRIAVEVLRGYLGRRPLLGLDRESAVAKGESTYRFLAYSALLVGLGTTFDEVRRAKTAPAADRRALAERLAITLTPPAGGVRHDELDDLLRLPEAAPTDPDALTEEFLERVFGLPATSGPDLNDGIKTGDTAEQLRAWRFSGVDPGRNTDPDGLVHIAISKTVDGVEIAVFSDPARSRLAARGSRSDATGRVRLGAANGSGLTGSVTLAYTADAVGVSIAVAPFILGRRLAHLRGQWFAEDWPETAAAAPAGPADPVVDPYAIGLPDLRSTRVGDPAYDLWISRLNVLAALRAALTLTHQNAADPSAALEQQLDQALTVPGDPVTTARLVALIGAEQAGERIESRVAAIGLSLPAFRFMARVIATVSGGQDILGLEWELLRDTLVSAHRRRQFEVWRAAERAAGITLSPSFFRTAAAEDAPGLANDPDTPLWLSTGLARRAWRETLAARYEQEANVVAGVDATRRAAEETALPHLRDALAEGTDAEGSDAASRAEWLTRRLLLDMRTAASHQTTRAAQAIETLQELVFRLRTGQFDTDNPRPARLTSVRAVVDADGRTHLLAADDAQGLWHRVWDGSWRSWRFRGSLPGNTTPNPPSEYGVVQHGDGFDVGVVGADQQLWLRRFRRGWQPWELVPRSGPLSGAPALVADGEGLDAYVHRALDAAVLQHHVDATTWTPPQEIGATSQRSPAAVRRTPGTVDLILAKSAPSLFQPVHRRWTGAAWVEEDLDGVLGSDVALITTTGADLQIFADNAGRLQHKVHDGGWQPWEVLDPAAVGPTDPQLVGTPTACVQPDASVDVFANREERGVRKLWHRRRSAAGWGAWEVVPGDGIALGAGPDFDAEWTWLGSYASYRSAAMVRFYPDFLLLPSLAPHQTPAFGRLVQASRPGQQLTAEHARDLARDYSDYLDDVAHLRVEASCRALVPAGTVSGLRSLMFMFGRASSGRAYWCTFDPLDDETGYAQSFWAEIPLAGSEEDQPGLTVDRVIGATPWVDVSAERHHLYFFFVSRDWSGRKLQQARYDITTGTWEPAQEIAGSLPAAYFGTQPGTVDNNDVVIVQTDSADQIPQLALRPYGSTSYYVRPVNHDANGFQPAASDWSAFFQPTGILPGSTLRAALRCKGLNWIVMDTAAGVRAVTYIPDNDALTNDLWAMPFGGGSTFVGALPGSDRNIYVFVERDGAHLYQRTALPSATKPRNFSAAVIRVMPHSGSPPAFFATVNGGGGAPGNRATAFTCHDAGDEISGHHRFDVIPAFSAPSASRIQAPAGVVELQTRRAIVADTYGLNASASESILQYLREAYRLVPQQLALGLQASGQFVDALDLFATVYDYRAPVARRSIDRGLVLDAQLPATSVLRWPEGWLLDPLNPHAIARTRGGATIRYAISVIVACCNAYADAEFSTDDPEALVRARVLYDTALQLCDLPELRQDIPDCDALQTLLEVRPGETVPPEVAAALGAARDDFTSSPPLKLSEFAKIKVGLLAAKAGTMSWDALITELTGLKKTVDATPPAPNTLSEHLSRAAVVRAGAHGLLLTDPSIEVLARHAGAVGVAIATGARS